MKRGFTDEKPSQGWVLPRKSQRNTELSLLRQDIRAIILLSTFIIKAFDANVLVGINQCFFAFTFRTVSNFEK